jgi:hypothetical protein
MEPPCSNSPRERPFRTSEILLAPFEAAVRIRVLIAFRVKDCCQWFWATVKYTCFTRLMNFLDAAEYYIPVWPTEICLSTQACDCICHSASIIDHDICSIVGLDLCSHVLLKLVAFLLKVDLRCESQYGFPCPAPQ